MKVILAIGHPQVEKAIEKNLPTQCEVVGVATYREAVLSKLQDVPTADVLLIRDNLQGSLPIMKLIHQVRADYPHCRIVLMTKTREAGDPFLSAVLSYAVWDIILGYKVQIKDIVDYILNPRTFKDVERFQKRTLVDETVGGVEESESVEPIQETVNPESTPPTPIPIPVPIPVPSSSQVQENLLNLNHSEGSSIELPTFDSISTSPPEPQAPPLRAERPIRQNPFPMELETPPATEPVPIFRFNEAKEQLKESQPQSQPAMEESVPPRHSKAKLFSTEDMESVKKPLVKNRKAVQMDIKNSPITMSLVGFKGGVGTSQTAFNLAIQLAQHKNRVLYVELNDHSVPLTYLYNLSSLKGGLEDALHAVYEGNSHDVFQFVTQVSVLKKQIKEKDMVALLKPYPDTLDFITFSHFFNNNKESRDHYHPECLQEFLMSLLLSQGYQYIILDINAHSHPTLVSQGLRASKYIFPVVTQDMLSIAQTVECLKEIHESRIPLNQKTYFIVNRYDANCYSHQSMLKWANHELPFKVLNAWIVPEYSNVFNKANDRSRPVVLASPPKPLLQAFETMHNYLKTM